MQVTSRPIMKDCPIAMWGTCVKRPSLKINVASNWAALAISVVIGFFLTPFIVSRLGKTAYGLWTLIYSFVGYYGLLDFGVGAAVTRYIARRTGTGDRRGMNEIAGTAMAMFCTTGALAVVLSLSVAGSLAAFFDIPAEHFPEFKHAVWILGLAVGIGFPASVIESAVAAHEKFVALNAVRIAGNLLRAGLILLALTCNQGLLGISAAILLTAVLRLAMAGAVSRRYAPGVHFSMARARLSVWWELVRYGGIVTLIMLATLVQTNAATFVVGKFVGVKQVGVFGIALIIIQYVRQFAAQASSVLSPRFAALDGACAHAEVESLLLRATSNCALLAFGLGAIVTIIAPEFVRVWVGPDFAEAVPILRILLAGHILCLSQGPGVGLLYAVKKHQYYAIAMSLQAAAALVLGVLLAPKYGSVGVAFGTTAALLLGGLFEMVYIPMIAQIPIWRYLKRFGAPMIVGIALVLVAGLLGALDASERQLFPSLILKAALVTLVYGAFSLLVPESLSRSLLFGRG